MVKITIEKMDDKFKVTVETDNETKGYVVSRDKVSEVVTSNLPK